jgi:DNA-directed RNA polymerase subunit H (RpoH/RPB5)
MYEISESKLVPQSCITTLHQLIETRGFFCTEESLKDAFKTLEVEGVEFLSCKSKNGQQTLRVLFFYDRLQKKIMKDNTDREQRKLGERDQLLIIHVILEDKTAWNRNVREQDDRVTYLTQKELIQNILLHKWVPLHEKVDDRERNHVCKVYNIQDLSHTLPLLSLEDPIAKFHGWKCGDIIRITRKPLLCPRSGPASKHIGSGCGTYISYRYVAKIHTEDV